MPNPRMGNHLYPLILQRYEGEFLVGSGSRRSTAAPAGLASPWRSGGLCGRCRGPGDRLGCLLNLNRIVECSYATCVNMCRQTTYGRRRHLCSVVVLRPVPIVPMISKPGLCRAFLFVPKELFTSKRKCAQPNGRFLGGSLKASGLGDGGLSVRWTIVKTKGPIYWLALAVFL